LQAPATRETKGPGGLFIQSEQAAQVSLELSHQSFRGRPQGNFPQDFLERISGKIDVVPEHPVQVCQPGLHHPGGETECMELGRDRVLQFGPKVPNASLRLFKHLPRQVGQEPATDSLPDVIELSHGVAQVV
jgi:hypothetical protein